MRKHLSLAVEFGKSLGCAAFTVKGDGGSGKESLISNLKMELRGK
jgi:hypothetical protein